MVFAKCPANVVLRSLRVGFVWRPAKASLEPAGEELVVYDELGAGQGSLIAISEGGEAAQPFYPNMKPVDAYNGAILDSVDVTRNDE